MLDILTRAGSFVAIIILGYVLKLIGFFKQEDFTILSRITIRITLPAAIITSFASKEIDMSLLSLGLLGLSGGLLYVLLGFVCNQKASREDRAFAMLNLAGYNIGTFVLPFAQSFLGPMGVIAASLFDTGNSMVCLGGAYSLAAMVKDGSGFSIKRILRSLFRSVPFVCYVVILTMKLFHIPTPELVISCAGIIGNANAFMAMLMIGVGLNLKWKRSQLTTIFKMLALRYGLGGTLAAIYYFVLPLPVEVRQALVILAVSPIGSATAGFTAELKGDVGMSSALTSITIIISILLTILLLSVML